MPVTQKAKLTETFVKKATYSKQQADSGAWPRDIWWDTELTGFGIRLYPTGRKVFIIEYRIDRRKRSKTIGAHGLLTVSQARDRARRDLVGLLDGIDPLSDRDESKAALTFEELAGIYLERHARPHKKSCRLDEERLRDGSRLMKAFGGKLARNITHSDVLRFHTDVGKSRKPIANALIRLLSVMFNKGIQWELLPDSHRNPAKGIKFFKEHSRERFVTKQELPRLIDSIEQVDNVYVRSMFWLYLLLGLRKEELKSCKWEQIDFERKELALPDTKGGNPHYLPLSDVAIEIFKGIPKLSGNPHVFVGRKEGRHVVNINKQWWAVRERAGLADVQIHDLRRTVGSWLAQKGNTLYLIGKVLNHADVKTTAIYARFQTDDIGEALEQHSKQIMGIAGKTDGRHKAGKITG